MANSFKEAAERKKALAEAQKAQAQEQFKAEEVDIVPVEPVEPEAEASDVAGDKLDSILGPAKKKKNQGKTNVCIYMSEDDKAWLQKTAKMRDMSVSELVTKIIAELRG